MCLLVLIYQQVPEYPLIVLANRDEDPARGGEAPKRWPEGIAAPRDPRAGGTWVGVNSHGVLSAVTNRAGPTATGLQKNSRGTLTLEALKEKTAFDAHRRAERIPTFLFSPFNWIYADRENAFSVEHGGPTDLTVRLRPGLHALSNEHDLGLEIAAAVGGKLGIDPGHDDLDRILSKLKNLAGTHEPVMSETHRICKHDSKSVPRTVSSSVIALHETNRARHRWLYHEGPPCENRWADVSDLLR